MSNYNTLQEMAAIGVIAALMPHCYVMTWRCHYYGVDVDGRHHRAGLLVVVWDHTT